MSASFHLVKIGSPLQVLLISRFSLLLCSTYYCMLLCFFQQRFNLVNPSDSMRLWPKRFVNLKTLLFSLSLSACVVWKSEMGFGALSWVLQDLFWSCLLWELSHKTISFPFPFVKRPYSWIGSQFSESPTLEEIDFPLPFRSQFCLKSWAS